MNSKKASFIVSENVLIFLQNTAMFPIKQVKIDCTCFIISAICIYIPQANYKFGFSGNFYAFIDQFVIWKSKTNLTPIKSIGKTMVIESALTLKLHHLI